MKNPLTVTEVLIMFVILYPTLTLAFHLLSVGIHRWLKKRGIDLRHGL